MSVRIQPVPSEIHVVITINGRKGRNKKEKLKRWSERIWRFGSDAYDEED